MVSKSEGNLHNPFKSMTTNELTIEQLQGIAGGARETKITSEVLMLDKPSANIQATIDQNEFSSWPFDQLF